MKELTSGKSPNPPPPSSQPFDFHNAFNKAKSFFQSGKLFFRHLENSQAPADDVLVGKVGFVTQRVTSTERGEIEIAVRGGTETFLAITESGTIDRNMSATVVGVRLPRTVVIKASFVTVD